MTRRRPFQLRAGSLVLRMLGRDDVTTFSTYRNIAEVARYQDWPLPYTRDLAHQLVDEMELLGEPSEGAWTQLAMEFDGTMIGDYAIWLDDTGRLAMVGYTVDPRFQGRSHAVAATELVVDWLFTERGVHRIAATIDPRNAASARVLERCGFEHVGTAREAAWSHGVWTDDTRFSLLEPQWRAWITRPTGMPTSVELVEVSADNLDAVLAVELAHSQRGVIRGPAESIAEAVHAARTPAPWYRAVVADGSVVGFVMVDEAVGRPPRVLRLIVDRRHQRRGIASLTLTEFARSVDHEHLEVVYPDDPGGPEVFYGRLGFLPTGERTADGQVVARTRAAELSERPVSAVGEQS